MHDRWLVVVEGECGERISGGSYSYIEELTMSIAQELAEYICGARLEHYPEDVVEIAKHCVIDSVGVALYGTKFEAAGVMLSFARETGGKQESTVLGDRLKVPAPLAALVNGVSVHVADFDDGSVWMQGHPSSVLIPAVLALCEARGASGETLLNSFIAGTEIGGKLGKVMTWAHYKAGWHGTGTIGTVAAAAAASKVINLNGEQTANALGIAASGAAGLRQNFGSMTKSYHAGQAAHNGVLAACLAEKGFTASTDIFEGDSGFFRSFVGTGDPISLPKELGAPYALKEVMFKKYPSCAGSHGAVDAILDLKGSVIDDFEEVRDIECRVLPVMASALAHSDPKNSTEAKFSLQFCVSAALITGQLGIDQFNSETIQSTNMQAMMKKVRMVPDPGLEELAAEKSVLAPVKVIVKLSNGKEYVRDVIEARGCPSNPMERRELESKFLECSSRLLSQAQSKTALEVLSRIETVGNVSEITEILTPA